MVKRRELYEMGDAIFERIKRLEDIVDNAGLCMKDYSKENVEEYRNLRLEQSGCEDVPISEMYSQEELRMLASYAKDHNFEAVFDALAIGFSNGVKWERKKLKSYKPLLATQFYSIIRKKKQKGE